MASSSAYETAPQGEVTDQPDFLTPASRSRRTSSPEELLDACKQVERELGREPGGPRHGPRPIDVDVLLLGDVEHRSERLTLPHPEVAARRFVLEPLLELDPDAGAARRDAALDFTAAVADQPSPADSDPPTGGILSGRGGRKSRRGREHWMHEHHHRDSQLPRRRRACLVEASLACSLCLSGDVEWSLRSERVGRRGGVPLRVAAGTCARCG